MSTMRVTTDMQINALQEEVDIAWNNRGNVPQDEWAAFAYMIRDLINRIARLKGFITL